MKADSRLGFRTPARGATALWGLWLLAQPGGVQAAGRAAVDYEYTADVTLGAPGFHDYLTFDPTAARLYVSHYDRVTVIDTRTKTVVGSITPLHDSHGVAIVPGLHKGYADSGEDAIVKVFSLDGLTIQKEIKVSPDADGMVFDAHTGSVLVVAGDSRNLTVIDPRTDTVARTVDLPGKPEFLAVDGEGAAYLNLADLGSIAKVDIAGGKLLATWPLAGCKAPHGLAYDPRSRRLFSGCANGRMVVVDPANGRNLASLPIGSNSDGVAVDSARGLVFSANVDSLTVIKEGAADHDAVARTIPTFFGGRNMAVDPISGTLFVAYGHMTLKGGLGDLLNLRFGWDGVDVAVFAPRP